MITSILRINMYAIYTYHSKKHPDLESVSSSETKKSTQGYQRSCETKRKPTNTETETHTPKTKKMSKIKRLSNSDVREFMLKHNIRRDTELLAKAHSRKQECQKDLANSILSKPTKSLNDL